MNMIATCHFSDTRTPQGRVRFLLRGSCAELVVEGPGWQHRSAHGSLEDAALYLALLPVPQPLYEASLADLSRRQRWRGSAA